MYFTLEQVAELRDGHLEACAKFHALRDRYVLRQYKNSHAKEYALHGFARRLGTLSRCIDRVFELLPPDLEDIPAKHEVEDATINIQAFVFNVFGCLDNLAWIWVYEKGVTGKDGKKLDRKSVGLGKDNKQVRHSFSGLLRSYLYSLDPWFTHITDFRDALVHRIPLHIPPFIIPLDRMAEYERLGTTANEAAGAQNFAEYDRLIAAQNALGTFRPWMTHSFNESAPTCLFHFQLLADFNTIDEIARKLLEEIER